MPHSARGSINSVQLFAGGRAKRLSHYLYRWTGCGRDLYLDIGCYNAASHMEEAPGAAGHPWHRS